VICCSAVTSWGLTGCRIWLQLMASPFTRPPGLANKSPVSSLVILDRNLKLRNPLGLWLSPPTAWNYRYSLTLDRIFVRKGHIWSVLRRSAARPNRCLHSGVLALLNDIAPSLPSDLIRADVSTRCQRFILQSVGEHLMTPVPPIPTQLDDVCTHLPRPDQWA
jgi:hypothetical protein